MTTVTVDTTLVGRPTVIGNNSVGYALTKILIPNVPHNGPDSVASVAVTLAGSAYTGIPVVGFTSSSGSGATAHALMKALTVTTVTPQSGAGSYAPADTITPTGATGTEPVITVSTTQVVSAGVAAGGSGGTNGTQTVTGTTGTGTKFQASVTVAGGAITAVNSISVPGNYTVNPTLLTAEPVTGASLTGATLNIKMGVLAATITTPGSLSVLASAPVSQGSSSGPGTGFTGTLTYGVSTVVVDNGGQDYLTAPGVTFTGGAGSGATATSTLAGANDAVTVNLSLMPPLPNANYGVFGLTDSAAVVSYGAKTTTTVPVTITPLGGATLAAGFVDLVLALTA